MKHFHRGNFKRRSHKMGHNVQYVFFRASNLFDATGKYTSWESARIYGLSSAIPDCVMEHIPEEIQEDITEVWSFNPANPLRFLAHLAYMPMSLCNHGLSVMCRCPLLSSSSLASLLVSSVYSCPSDSINHRNFISCKYMHIYP